MTSERAGLYSSPLACKPFTELIKMKNDPYLTSARFSSTCPETGKPISKGDKIAYYPKARKAYHIDSKSADSVRYLLFSTANYLME